MRQNISMEAPVSAGGSSRPKKLLVSVQHGVLRLTNGDKEKLNRSLANSVVSHIGGGRIEIKFEKSAASSKRKSPRPSFGVKNKLATAAQLVLFVGDSELESWIAALAAASNSEHGALVRKTSSDASALRALLEVAASQESFWKEQGLRKVIQILIAPPISPEVTLLAAKMLFAQVLRVGRLDVVSFELLQSVSRMLCEFSALSQSAACLALLSALCAADDVHSSLSELLVELRIPKALCNLLVMEEDNLSPSVQELILRCLVMITSRSDDMADSVSGSDYLLRYLRMCLSLEADSALLKLTVQLLGNLSLAPSFREALADEFNVAEVLVGLLSTASASKNHSLCACLRKTLANVAQHPFMASQLLFGERMHRLRRSYMALAREDIDGDDYEEAVLWTMIILANAVACVDASLARNASHLLIGMVDSLEAVAAAEYARLLVLLADKVNEAVKEMRSKKVIELIRKHNVPEADLYLCALQTVFQKK